MPKEDYLLKYLEKLSRVITAMIGFRDKGFPEDALRLADETYRELLSLDLDMLAIMPVETFLSEVESASYTISYLEALAQMTLRTAECYGQNENEKLFKVFCEKALVLYKLLNDKDKTFSFERESIIAELESVL